MRRSTSTVRRACAVGTTVALIGLTTGLGLMTATSASAATDAATSTEQTPAATTTSDAGTTTSDSGTSTSSSTDTGSSTPADTAAPTATPTAPATTAPSKQRAVTPAVTPADTTPTASPSPTAAAAADPSVAITGTALVGSELRTVLTGFDKTKGYSTTWTETDSATILSNDPTYTPTTAQAGGTVTVTIIGTDTDGAPATEQATSAVIAETPVFVDADGQPITDGADSDDPLLLDTNAGEQFSYTFRATSTPAPSYKLDWYYADESEDAQNIVSTRQQAANVAVKAQADEGTTGDDGDFTPADQLPEGITFDPKTGTLSGSAMIASYYDFAITATSGSASASQFVELSVNPGVAAGISAFALDKTEVTSETGPRTVWIISPDGTSTELRTVVDEDGFPSDVEVVEGSNPTVKQGGTLLIQGTPVDRFGNEIDTTDDEGNPTFVPTVTSNVASDVVAPYTENGAEGQGVIGVTFPHASTHTLTVSSGSLQSVSFAVTVVPTVAPVAVVGTVPNGGQLAFTGTDATGALPWALGLVLAGAGLLGVRTARRRQTQR